MKKIVFLALFVSLLFSEELGFKGVNLDDDYLKGCAVIKSFESEIKNATYVEKEGMFCALARKDMKSKFYVSTFFKDKKLASIIFNKDFIDAFWDTKNHYLDDVVVKMIKTSNFQGEILKKKMMANSPNAFFEYSLKNSETSIEITVMPKNKIILKQF